MEAKMKAWNEMSKLKYQADDVHGLLDQAKQNYIEELVNETTEAFLKILKEEDTLSERDFKLFLGNLAKDVRNLYAR